MTVMVQLATSLREYCNGLPDFELPAATLQATLLRIRTIHPELYSSICDESGRLRRHVNLFVNDTLIESRSLNQAGEPLHSGDVLSIYPAVSGG
jgi:molybdopterin converting factor small subunit